MKALRTLLITIGVVVVLAGWAGRSIQGEYGGTDYESVVRDDGTVAIYDSQESNATFEIEEVDESTANVYAIPNDGSGRDLVFSGTPAAAADFYESQGRVPVFEGSPAGADAWREEHEEPASMLVPNAAIGLGIALILVGLASAAARSRISAAEAQVAASENEHQKTASRP